MGRSANKVKQIAERGSDAKKAMLEALGDFKDEVFHNQVLVATYIQPAVTAGGIHLPQSAQDEDIWQGTVFLVVAMGPGAFLDDNIAKFHGKKLKIGDWVMARSSDGLNLNINDVPCKLFEDTRIMMRISDPQRYW